MWYCACCSDVVYNVFLESTVWEILMMTMYGCNDYVLGVLHDDIMGIGIGKGAVPHDCCSIPMPTPPGMHCSFWLRNHGSLWDILTSLL